MGLIAHAPPHAKNADADATAWIDFAAPPGKPTEYCVAAIDAADDSSGAGSPTGPSPWLAATWVSLTRDRLAPHRHQPARALGRSAKRA